MRETGSAGLLCCGAGWLPGESQDAAVSTWSPCVTALAVCLLGLQSGEAREGLRPMAAPDVEMLRVGTSRKGEGYPQVCSELLGTDLRTIEEFLG